MSIKKNATHTYILVLSILFFSQSVFADEPYAINFAVSDSFKIALGKLSGNIDGLANSPKIPSPPRTAPLALCEADALAKINSKTIQTDCLVMSTFINHECNEQSKCLPIKISPSVRTNRELWEALMKTVSKPCDSFVNLGNERGEHWHGFIYPFFISKEILSCKNGVLPYNQVLVQSGTSTEIFTISNNASH